MKGHVAMRAGQASFDFNKWVWPVAAVLTAAFALSLIWISFQPPASKQQQLMSAMAADAPPAGSVYADEVAGIDPAAPRVLGAEGGDKVWKRQPNNLYYGKTEAPDCRAKATTGIVGDFEYIDVPVGAEMILKFDSPEDAAALDPTSFDDSRSSFYLQLRPARDPNNSRNLSYETVYTRNMPGIDVTRVDGDEVHFTCPGATGMTLLKVPFHGGMAPVGNGDSYKKYCINFVQR